MTKQTTTAFIAALVILAAVGFFIFKSADRSETNEPLIANFDECAQAGYPIMESFPRQCRTPEGELFVEDVSPTNPEPKPIISGNCFVGGCSSEVCSDQKDVASNCIYKPEFACYKNGRCESQSNGQCGWTQTPELKSCLNERTSNPSLDIEENLVK